MLSTIFSISTLYFFIISLINVILSSTKSICTVRYGRGINIVMNVISYSFYNVVVKQTASLPLEETIVATAIANAIGVWTSYVVLDLFQKDRLWKVEVVLPKCHTELVHNALKNISHDYVEMGPKTRFSFLCETRKETETVVNFCKNYEGRFFAVENKL